MFEELLINNNTHVQKENTSYGGVIQWGVDVAVSIKTDSEAIYIKNSLTDHTEMKCFLIHSSLDSHLNP